MSTTQIIARDAYIRTTRSDGKSTVTQHRVWDAERFLAAQQREAMERARKDNVPPDIVTSATADEYRSARA
ncbi:hypothetical protein [Parazoarcus communis]|uniref:Uncharacterized protein n=1 Tax=Parazoarcus communis SWub3 = DSM 12120 TaxID=1121029 RepID=A0A323UWV9_9RHOO|nr:hypothetical protein [Parazoarcus communis]NMG70339.1 hypothetical protein [Parazoarcus communis SWub3 = DSM 12120]PZA16110.1 hypothetical protein DNK49_13960 [Azoarcus communis] [Parazoarcus communis SWub3 = DSM 12120]